MMVREVDNRTMEDMLAYYEARIEALANRVDELETELAQLQRDRNAHLGAVEG